MSKTILEESQWKQVELESICQKISVGLAISVTPHMGDKGTKLIRNQNIRANYFDRSSVVYVSNDFANTQKTKLVRAGDVISVRTGVNIGETCVVPDDFDGALTFTTLIVRPHKSFLNSYYLSQYMNSHLGRSEITRLTVGGGKENLNSGDLKKYRIFLPPIHVQEEIAEVLSTWDEAIAKTEKLITAKQKQKKYLIQNFISRNFKLPEIDLVPIGKVITLSQYGLSVASDEQGSTPIVGMKNLSDGSVQLNNLAYVSLEQEDIDKFCLQPGDILLNRTNSYDLVGKVAIYESTQIVVFASYLVRFRFDTNKVLPEFINYLMNSYPAQQRLKRIATKGVSQANINPTVFKELFLIPLLPLSKQKSIVEILKAVDMEIEILKKYHALLQKQKRGLMQKLLTGEWCVAIKEAA